MDIDGNIENIESSSDQYVVLLQVQADPVLPFRGLIDIQGRVEKGAQNASSELSEASAR